MHEPIWVDRLVVDAVHFDQLQEHGGLPGILNDHSIQSALARPKNKWHYESNHDIATLGAGYGFALATNHGYRDGNKRVAFVVMAIFLDLNGWQLDAPEPEVVDIMRAVRARQLDEQDLAIWLRQRMTPLPPNEVAPPDV